MNLLENGSASFANEHSLYSRNDRDFREESDSAAVSDSKSISMTNLLDTGLPVLVPDISPDFLTWEDHWSSLFHSEEFDELASITGLPVPVFCTFHELRGTFWLSDLVSPRFSAAVEARTVGSLTQHLDTKFVISIDFAVTLSSHASSCVLFDIALHLLLELKWPMMNKHKRWFHSSRVKFSFVGVSASWFWVSMYLIWIFGSKLILSKQPIKSNSVGSGKMFHCKASSLLWSSWSPLRCLQRKTT